MFSKENIMAQIAVLSEKYNNILVETGKTIWNFAELSGQEYESTCYLKNLLKEHNFEVASGIAGYPTSFIASYSNDEKTDINIGLLCEYDALPNMSTVNEGGGGHACGHNLFAAGAVTTALILKDFITKNNINAAIKVFGTPSEEKNGSKPYMAKQGYFDNMSLFLGFHPLEFNGVLFKRHNAIISKDYAFYGKSSHAGAEPELGRSALDAVELMNIGANYLREHVTDDVRIHYIITNGGDAANVVPDFAKSHYVIRAQEYDNLHDVEKRIDNIAQGAALMTECTCKSSFNEAFANTIINKPFARIAQSYLESYGAPEFTHDEIESSKVYGNGNGLLTNVEPLSDEIGTYGASTDEGDVSWQGPWIRICTAVFADGTPGHSKEVTKQANMDYAYKALSHNVKIASSAIIDIITHEDKLKALHEDYRKEIEEKNYNYEINKYPTKDKFPNMPGVHLSGEDNLIINKNDISFIRDESNVYIQIQLDSDVLYTGEFNDTVKLSKSISDTDILTLYYKIKIDGNYTLLGYYSRSKGRMHYAR